MTKSREHKLIVLMLIVLLILAFGFAAPKAMAVQSSDSNFGKYSYDKSLLSKMQDKYVLKPIKFKYSHKALKPLSTIKRPDYRLKEDGVYTSKEKKDNNATIILTGDLMCQTKQQKNAKASYGKYYFNDSFYYVKDKFKSADLVVGNLETTLSESASYMSEETSVDNHPNCNAPSTYLDALRYAGYDLLVNSNNHNYDGGLRGIYQTCAHLNQYGFMHTGLFTKEDEKRYVIVNVDGIKVGFVSYSKHFNKRNNKLSDEGNEIFLNRYSNKKMKKDVEACKAAGAEYIIGYIHWGVEYTNSKNSSQDKVAKEMANAGVDFIAGSHPHALQKYSAVYSDSGKKVPVVYSLGNFVSQMAKHDICKDTVILKLKLKKNKSGEVVLYDKLYIPCRCMTSYNGRNYAVVPITKERRTKGQYSSQFSTSYKRIKKVMGKNIRMSNYYK